MIAVFDSSVIIDLFNPRLDSDHRAKLDELVRTLKQQRAKVLIPAPAFAEVMVWADAARDKYYSMLSKSSTFQIAAFDGRAAMECSILLESAFSKKERRSITKTKFKFDWQIVAVAKSRSADVIYAEDDDIERCALRAGIQFQRPSALPLPPSAKQRALDLHAAENLRANAPFGPP